jgi:hypothetical protein
VGGEEEEEEEEEEEVGWRSSCSRVKYAWVRLFLYV